MIQTKPCREALTRNCLVEHAAQCDSVDRARLQAKSNNGAGELIHHDQDPMGPQMDGFNLKQVHAPQAVFGLTQQGEPSWTTTADFGAVMHRQPVVFGRVSAQWISLTRYGQRWSGFSLLRGVISLWRDRNAIVTCTFPTVLAYS